MSENPEAVLVYEGKAGDTRHVEDLKNPEEKDVFEHVEERQWDPKMVRWCMWKVDLILMPVLTGLYLFASLDKSSLGNAKSLGMIKELGKDPDGKIYAFLNSLYFIAYAPFMVPFALLAKRTRFQFVLSVCGIYWGIASACFAAVNNFSGAYACRFMVGLGEAGFSPIIQIYLARWYTRKDLGKRIGIWLCAAPLGGFLNGIISYGVSFIHGSLSSWRILFLLEGLITVAIGITALIILPEDIRDSKWWFTDEEKDFLEWRRRHEASTEDHAINWRHALPAFYRWQSVFPCLEYMTLQISGAALSAFLPTFEQENGYTGAIANVATLGPYGSAAVLMVVASILSDKWRNRGGFIMLGMVFNVIGFGIYLGAKDTNHAARTAALIFAESGHYISTPLILVHQAVNAGSESRRAVALPLTVATAQAVAIGSGYLFPSTDGPAYTMGSAVCLALSVVGCIVTAIYHVLLVWANRKRDRIEGKPPADVQPDTLTYADAAPGFRYQL